MSKRKPIMLSSKLSWRNRLTSTDKGVEHETVLYHISIEHGKIGSKVRDHDTIFLSVDR